MSVAFYTRDAVDSKTTAFCLLFALHGSHPGTCNLSLNVVDPDERLEISLQSCTLKVSPANTLLNALDSLAGVSYKVA
ncbi:hypothetical protein CLV58_11495 [Spirosoma oryzae]|uniref:Uncharacterized protein n=1 Tax=Spirosoma oryzae TaxID=1469603 RepID=A0A2T0SQ33_9BACT|nr:hypothetical protein CLV58_11495 [Spirosoma oryzae]